MHISPPEITDRWSAGRIDRSRMICALAKTFAESARLGRESSTAVADPAREERARCYWSIVLILRLFGEPEQMTHPRAHLPSLPHSSYTLPPGLVKQPAGGSTTSPQTSSMIEVFVELSDVWSMAMTYINTRGVTAKRDSFPWNPDSQYSLTTAALMDLGQKLPLAHRYRSIEVSNLTPQIMAEAREYWAPWLLTRLMYHTILCILNHPLLLTLQIRGVQNVSEGFLHHTAFSISNHVSWIRHLTDLMVSRSFSPSDPLVGYCLAVVATVELQRSFSRHKDASAISRQNFEEFVRIISALGDKWSSTMRLVGV